MNIEITSCNDCPFTYIANSGGTFCYIGYIRNKVINCRTNKGSFKRKKPHNCPIPKEGITVKPKQ